MSSVSDNVGDRTARSRIRDAAITRMAEVGADRATIREIAGAAGVSPGLVLHHFESKHGLREACDQYVVATILERDTEWMATGESDANAVRDAYGEALPILKYLARSLADDSPSARTLFDGVVQASERSLELGVENGLVLPSIAPHDRAVLLVAWQLGALVLSPHVERAFGAESFNSELTTRIGRIGAEMLTGGVFADTRYRDAGREFDSLGNEPST